MGMNTFAFLNQNPTTIKFIVQNINGTKFVTVFNIDIAPNQMIDLMSEPGISQEEIRNSLIKGELYNKIRVKDIKVLYSNVDLQSFDNTFNNFIQNVCQIPVGSGPPGGNTAITGTYNCALDVDINDVVFLIGSDFVDLASANDPSLQPVIGIVQLKPTVSTAVVMYYGELGGLSGLIPSATYYLDVVPGAFTPNPPSTSGNIVQKLGFAKDANTLMLQIDRDFVQL